MARQVAGVVALSLVLAGAAGGSWAAEPDLRPELAPIGRIEHLEVTPAGHLWIGTATGHAYVSFDLNRTWQPVEVSPRRSEPDQGWTFSDHLSQVRFFDQFRGLVAGYIGQGNDTIYRTDDGGQSWSPVLLPSSLWVYDAQVTAEGLAWLVGSSGELLFSDDYGRSWGVLTPPFDSSDRSHSVHFETRLHGVVGALSDALAVSDDGGRSWQRIATPGQRGLTDDCHPDRRIEKVRFVGERLVVHQCSGVYAALAEAEPAWVELTVGARALVDFELHPEGLVAVADDHEIVFLDRDLALLQPTGFSLGSSPLSLAVSGTRTAILEGDGKVTIGEGDAFSSSRMFGQGVARTWPITDFDRGPDGVLWGVTSFFLYRSDDAGRTWERRAELPRAAAGCAVTVAGDVLLWDGHGWVGRWSPELRTPRADPGLDGLDLVGLVRRGKLWLAYGGMQYETMRRVEVARTYFGGQFAGSVDHGFVAASMDGGATWSVVDRWEDGGVQALFLGDDDTLTLLSWLGAVRRGPLLLEGPRAPAAKLETVLPANEETIDEVPYVEQAFFIEFVAGEEGWVAGWTHHLGVSAYRTIDGGLSWNKLPADRRPFRKLERLGAGAWLAIHHDRILAWNRGRFTVSKQFPGAIRWTRTDATGALLVELADGALWSLSADGTGWSEIR